MKNVKVYQEFHGDKKVEEHCIGWYPNSAKAV